MLAASLRIYPLVAALLGGGLFFILLLRRKFKLDKALDDPARIAATQSLIVQEEEMSLKDNANRTDGYVIGEAIIWVLIGLIWLAAKISIYLLAVVLVCCGTLSILILRRVFKLDIQERRAIAFIVARWQRIRTRTD